MERAAIAPAVDATPKEPIIPIYSHRDIMRPEPQPPVQPQQPPVQPPEVQPPQPAVQSSPVTQPQIVTQIEPPPASSSSNKRKEPDTAPEVFQEPPLMWYDIGEESDDGYRYVKAETVPNQRRILGRMTDKQKLEIAHANKLKRDEEQKHLAEMGIHIKYTGRNTPMGIPGHGYYNEEDPNHKLAIIKVGTNRRTPLARQLQDEIDQLIHPAIQPQSPCTLNINCMGKPITIYLYVNDVQVVTPEHNWFKIEKQPHSEEINLTITDMDQLYGQLMQNGLSQNDAVTVNNHVADIMHYNVYVGVAHRIREGL